MLFKKSLKWIILAVVTCLAVTFLGCNQGKINTGDLDPGYQLDPETVTGRIKVTTYLRSGDQSEIALDKWIQTYNKYYPNVTVKTDIIAWSAFATQVASGDIGDVYYTAEVDVYNYAVKNKAAMYLDSYIDLLNIDTSQIYTGLYDLGCYNGLLYMVPSDLSQNVFFTNVSALEEAGLSRPENDWKWDDFRDYCKRLRKTNEDGTYSQVGAFFSTEVCMLYHFFVGWGGQWVDKVNKKVNFFSDEKVLRGFDELINMVNEGDAGIAGLTGAMGAKYAGVDSTSGYVFKLSTYINRIAAYEAFKKLGIKFDVSAMPEMPAHFITGGATGYLVYSKTRNPDAAATFALTLLSDEGQIAFNQIVGGGIPCTKKAIADGAWRVPYPEEEFNYDAFVCYPEAFTASWSECFVPPEIASQINKVIPGLVDAHFSNKKDYKDSLSDLEQTCNEIWATLFDE